MISRVSLFLLVVLTAFLAGLPSAWASGATDSTQTVVVRSITLKGNYRTRDRIILREMTLHPGDSVRLLDLPGRIAWDQRNINNTTLFVTVDVGTALTLPTDSTQLAQLDLTVTMKERWYFIAYPVFDLADRNF